MELRIEGLLEEVVRRQASDLHIQVGSPPTLRIDGSLVPINGIDKLTEELVEQLVFALVDEEQKQILLKDREIDFSFSFDNIGRFRVNAFHERGNLAAALRLIPNEIMTIDQLGLPPIINEFANYPRGLVLITGPAGVGKSTTLAALISKISHEKPVRILTIENPIEFNYPSTRGLVTQREVNHDTQSFANALRSALRQDPDVILIGEMRDFATISAAITLAETGHLVFATLHTNSAASTIDRIIDVFPATQQPQIKVQLSGTLKAVCAQRLIPATSGGRVVAAEVLIATSAVKNIIREGKTHQLDSVIQTGSEFGMQSMDTVLAAMVHQGKISYDEARNYASDLKELDRLVRA